MGITERPEPLDTTDLPLLAQHVYITRMASALPNAPVGNELVEAVLGQVGPRPSRARAVVLRNNGICSRHYAVNAVGELTHSNAQLTAQAVRALEGEGFAIAEMDLLACGTSSPDQLMPNHAVMVHGELGGEPCEVVATAGICVSGIMAMKYGFLSVLSGQSRNAVVTGSELASTFMRADNFSAECAAAAASLEKRPALAFEKDFLRWMLSDGAGALLLQNRPNTKGLSLKIEWIDQYSFANELPVCMYAGAEKREDGSLQGWREFSSQREASERSVMAVKQDVRLLEDGIRQATRKAFTAMRRRRGLKLDQVDWYLPHYSSEHFRPVMSEVMPDDFKIPAERWFSNLQSKGNVGSASIYLMLEELFASGKLKHGQKILCYVPESGRFSIAFAYLTVVSA